MTANASDVSGIPQGAYFPALWMPPSAQLGFFLVPTLLDGQPVPGLAKLKLSCQHTDI